MKHPPVLVQVLGQSGWIVRRQIGNAWAAARLSMELVGWLATGWWLSEWLR